MLSLPLQKTATVSGAPECLRHPEGISATLYLQREGGKVKGEEQQRQHCSAQNSPGPKMLCFPGVSERKSLPQGEGLSRESALWWG